MYVTNYQHNEKPLTIKGIPSSTYFAKAGGVIITFGIFDGMHIAHQRIIHRICDRAKELSVPSVVLVFRPRPVETLRGIRARPYLTAQDETVRLIKRLGVDHVGVIKFTRKLTVMHPPIFVRRLVRRIPIKELWLGPDVTLGRGPEGKLSSVKTICNEIGFSLKIFSQDNALIKQEGLMNQFNLQNIRAVNSMIGRRYKLPAYVDKHILISQGLIKFKLFVPELLYIPPDGEYAVLVTSVSFGGLEAKTHILQRVAVLTVKTARQIWSKPPELSLIADISPDLSDSFINIEFIDILKNSEQQLLNWAKSMYEKNETQYGGIVGSI
jgi:riboflavin kinase/FMN adenylyltransferase